MSTDCGIIPAVITGAQIRAARALLRIRAKDLAEAAGVSWNTVQRLESTDGVPSTNARTLQAIQEALESMGVRFTETGVEL